jgi:TM2 domain-containing membrane protein YozV
MQPQQQVPMAPRSKIVAGILGILLGFLGVHRFYLGYRGTGLAQLLITFTCVGMLITIPWGLIEGILILVGTINKDASGQPLKD